MTINHQLMVEGTEYTILISDDSKALLAASAAGSAVVGLWRPGTGQDLSMARYLVERPEDADEMFLETVVRRTHGLPLQIAGTRRLIIREFQLWDVSAVLAEPEDGEADRVFYNEELLKAYIDSQYGFYEYGLWALVDKNTGMLVGKAGITSSIRLALPPEETLADGLELGYHIFTPYRRQGYALEACRAIIDYAHHTFAPAFLAIKTDASNEASVRLAEKLGFTGQIYSAEETVHYLIAENC